MVDSHFHLQSTVDFKEIPSFISTVSQSLNYLVDISTNSAEYLKIRSLTLPGNLLFAAGLYPEHAPGYNQQMKDEFIRLIKKYPPNLIGEIGLDYHWDYGTPKLQETLFRDMIETAIQMNLPIAIHSRDAFEDTYRVLSDYQYKKDVIIHCFGYGPDEAEKFLEKGYIISFAGNLTYKNAKPLHRAAEIVPLDKLLFETDSPYLTPTPHRGKENNPLYVKHTYEFFAGLREMNMSELDTQIDDNFKRIFLL